MFKLLNRAFWVLSFLFGFVISFFLFVERGMYLDKIVLFFFTIIFGAIIKFVFFSSFVIKGALKNLVRKIQEEYLEEKNQIVQNENADFDKQAVGGDIGVIEDQGTQNDDSNLNDSFTNEELTQDLTESQSKVLNPFDLQSSQYSQTVEYSNFQESQIDESQNAQFSPTKSKQVSTSTLGGFFATNMLAKIGGILIFLGILFFLLLIYTSLPPIGRFYASFIVSFIVFLAGYIIYNKSYQKEGLVLFGTSFLINYLVILAGRYLIKDAQGEIFLNSIVTFLLLILNTFLCVGVSLRYKSNTMLFFGFLFAYINPFLIGASSDNPYMLLLYDMLITFGGGIVLFKQQQSNPELDYNKMFSLFLIGANALILTAPFSGQLHWAIKVLALMLISIVAILFCKKISKIDWMKTIFVINYIAFFILIYNGIAVATNIFNSVYILLLYMFFMFGFIGFGLLNFVLIGTGTLLFLVCFPIFMLIYMLLNGVLIFTIPLIILVMFIYLFLVYFIINKLKNNDIGYILLFGIIMLMFFVNTKNVSLIQVDKLSFIMIGVAGLVYLLFTYFMSLKQGLEKLFLYGTIGVIVMIFPLLTKTGPLAMFSVRFVMLVGLINKIFPLLYKNLKEKDTDNIGFGVIIGSIFALGFIYYYYFKSISVESIGMLFMGISVFYLVVGILLKQLNSFDIRIPEKSTLLFYVYFTLFLGVFNLGLYKFLINHTLVFSFMVVLQSVVLMMLVILRGIKSFSLYSHLLLFVGVISLIGIKYQGISMSYLGVMFGILILQFGLMYNMKIKQIQEQPAFNVLHLILVFLTTYGITELFNFTSIQNDFLLWTALFFTITAVYRFIANRVIVSVFVMVYYFLLVYHITQLSGFIESSWANTFYHIFVMLANVFVIYYTKDKVFSVIRSIIPICLFIYFFLITTIMNNVMLDNTFLITLYRGFLVFVLMYFGINKNNQGYRTLGLYVLALTLIKIFIYDIWYGLDNPIFRVIALMLMGGMLIYLSMLYTKNPKNSFSQDFDLQNLIGK